VSNFEYEPVLKHGDFGPSNILFYKEKQIVTGVIDEAVLGYQRQAAPSDWFRGSKAHGREKAVITL
jgi:hypothetical protein